MINHKWINSLQDKLYTIIINVRDNRNKFIYINKEKKKGMKQNNQRFR